MRSTYDRASVTPESTNASIEAMSLVRREIRSPSRRRSKKSSESPCRCAKNLVRRSSRKRSPIQLARKSSKKPSTPATKVSPTYAAAIHAKGPKSCGTSTWSMTSLNIQIIAVSTSGTRTISRRPRASHRRYGRAYGQNRRKISRTGTVGEALTSASPSAGVENSERSRALSRRLRRFRNSTRWRSTPRRRCCRSRCWFPAAPGSSRQSCRADGAFCDVPSEMTSLVFVAFESLNSNGARRSPHLAAPSRGV